MRRKPLRYKHTITYNWDIPSTDYWLKTYL